MSNNSFLETLRKSRSSKTSIIHQFLTTYDPASLRFHLFVEGDPDRSFYRAVFKSHVEHSEKLYIYNCEGKENVYNAFKEILTRYPDIIRTLFLVDKDVDDIIGRSWSSDPRIFTTDVYSIENYVAVKECIEKHFQDHIKIRRVEIDTSLIVNKFKEEQLRFYQMVTPLMAWIVAMRRRGHTVNLNDVNLSELFEVRDCITQRKRGRNAIKYLERVTQVKTGCDWRALRATTYELSRLQPKAYVRGKFDAWWFVAFIADAYRMLDKIARDGGGSSSQTVTITNSNVIQLLAPSAPAVPALANFAQFHCGAGGSFRQVPPQITKKRRLWGLFSKS